MSDGSASPTAHASGSLLDQWRLLHAACLDRQLSRGDIAVLFDVLDKYYRRHGNSRAAYSYLAAATGLSRRAVINSIRRLRAHGYIEVMRMGSGVRPTEYIPNWQAGHRNLTSASSSEARFNSEANSASPLKVPAVNSTLPKPSYVAGLQAGLRKEGPAPAVPPGGLDGPPAAPARDPFDELWNAYGRKQERSKAKAEYRKLDPDPTLHVRLVRAAADWKVAYEAQRRPSRFRKLLHTWLAGECWLEDGPEPYVGAKAATLAKIRKRGPGVDLEYRTWLENNLGPGDRVLVRFIDWIEHSFSAEKVEYDCDFVVLQGRRNVGRFAHRIAAPSQEFDQLCHACGDHGDVTINDFAGTVLWAVIAKDGTVCFEPYAEGIVTYQLVR